MNKKTILLGLAGAAAAVGLVIFMKKRNQTAALIPSAAASFAPPVPAPSSTPGLDLFHSKKWTVSAPGAAGYDGTSVPQNTFVSEHDGKIWYPNDEAYGVIISPTEIQVWNTAGAYLSHRILAA